MTKNNVLIMAGGTGGHVIPAISVARELMQKGYTVHWLGSVKGIENDLVPDAGYKLHRITVTGLRGNGVLKTLLAPLQLARAVWQTLKVFIKVKPVMALGMGGFASGPGGLLAVLTRTPLVIHEQNAIPGMTNKLLSRFASPLLQAFEGAFKGEEGLVTVGNPVRTTISKIPSPELRLERENSGLNVLVVGGSLGAVAINNVIIEASSKMQGRSDISIWHQAGGRNFDDVKSGYAQAGVASVKVSAFIADMAEAYSWADVVICRSGALTVSELMSAGVASILVPYPFAVDDHQTANGMFLVNAGAAILCDQSGFTSEYLIEELNKLLQAKDRILNMSIAARSLAKNDSAKIVANYCIEAAHDK